MKVLVVTLLTLLMGMTIAFGIAWFVGIWFPCTRIPLFIAISIWWLWIGLRYAAAMDRVRPK